MLGVEVLHQHESKSGIGRQMGKQFGERLQPASRRSDADDWKAARG
jgi:hypothetical protein